MLRIHNTLTKKIEEFTPLHPPKVGMYTCGMTVYDFAHIGHGRKYVGDDILRRVLTRFGYNVTHIQNVTDVGHMTSDADEGEDKLEKGAIKAGKSVWEVAQFFTDQFYASMDSLNVLRPHTICKATDHISDQITLIQRLVAKKAAYDTPEAVYFDVGSFPSYATLFGQKLDDKRVAVRAEVEKGTHKRQPADFVLWFKRAGKFKNHVMHWDSPWGDGFPGWHIECSAMSMKYLGDTIDIHTGGIDHIPVHHPNEIAQSEVATGKLFVRYWIHHEFLKVDGKKMSKSLGNIYTVDDVVKKGFDPLALRYLYMSAHYRKILNFTWEALRSAQNALNELRTAISKFKYPSLPAGRQISNSKRNSLSQEKLEKVEAYQKKFNETLKDDLNLPQSLAVAWEVVKSNIPSEDKYDLLMDFDEVLGLDLGRETSIKVQHLSLPQSKASLATGVTLNQGTITNLDKRELARMKGEYTVADTIRKQIENQEGVNIEDTPNGIFVKKKTS